MVAEPLFVRPRNSLIPAVKQHKAYRRKQEKEAPDYASDDDAGTQVGVCVVAPWRRKCGTRGDARCRRRSWIRDEEIVKPDSAFSRLVGIYIYFVHRDGKRAKKQRARG